MPSPSPDPTEAGSEALRALGATLKARRRAMGVNASTAAQAAGMSRVTLYRIERGEPSVTFGAYVSAARVLGLHFALGDSASLSEEAALTQPIRLVDYAQLQRLAWHLPGREELSPEEAFEVYEANWRHLERNKLSERERTLIDALARQFGGGRLLV